MVLQKTEDGEWIVKKKFTFAAIAFAIGTVFATKGVVISETVEDLVLVLGAYSTYVSLLLGVIFAADVADKSFNSGSYYPRSQSYR